MIGNLTRDPETKQLGSGQSVCRLGLASNRQFKNKQTGLQTQEVCFVDVDVWGAQAESCQQYLRKGKPVLVEGRLKFDSWQDADGSKRSKHAIVAERVTFLGSAQDDAENQGSSEGTNDTQSNQTSEFGDAQKMAAPKPRAPRAAPRMKTESEGVTGEISFKDEQPFSEDLPF